MKIVISAIGLLVGGMVSAYVFFSPEGIPNLPERADPNFDYENASSADQAKWMQKFTARFLAAMEFTNAKTIENGGSVDMTSTYKIAPRRRQLIVTLTPVKIAPLYKARLNKKEVREIQTAYQNVLMKGCMAKVTDMDLHNGTSIMFKAKTNFQYLPSISVTLSKETCQRFHEQN